MERYGGNPHCLIATPEIEIFPLTNDVDCIVLGSDGVFDRLNNRQIIRTVQQETLNVTKIMSPEQSPSSFEHISSCCGAAVNGILK